MTAQNHRGTIFLEDAQVLEHRAFAGGQHILCVHAPKAARTARAGSFAHLRCDPDIPLRRPLSIMRASPADGWIEFLYKTVGRGLTALARRKVGERVSVLAPIGNRFAPRADRPFVLCIGGGVGIPPMVFLADELRRDERFKPLVLMGSEVPFPFELVAAKLGAGGADAEGEEAPQALALLESWGVPSRLASNAGLAGAFAGYVPELARKWLEACSPETIARAQIASCGPEPMLRAVAALARWFDLPCELALEEYMACGVGGCAGCTVLVAGEDGPQMKRVCVDGPVFEAAGVYPE